MPTKRPRNMTRRQNRIHEIHAPQIAALRDMIVADALKVPGTMLKIALAVQKRFKADTPIFLSLETLAAECKVTRKTLYNHFPGIRKRWGIGFYTPSYSQRGAGFSTEVSFPISRVEKYRKYADFCESMGKNVPSFSSYLSASKATLKAWVKFTQHTSKVAAPPAADGRGPSLPGLATKEDSHSHPNGLGAEFWGYDDRELWLAATTERPSATLPESFVLGARMKWDAELCTLVGFSQNPLTFACVLVQFDGQDKYSWIEVEDLAPTQKDTEGRLGTEFWCDDDSFWVDATETRPPDVAASWLHARVEREDGAQGTVIGFPVAGSDERLENHYLVRYEPQTVGGDDVSEGWVMWEHVAKLMQLDAPEPEQPPSAATQEPMYGFHVGDRVRFAKRGPGTIKGFSRDGVEVLFDSGETLPAIVACALQRWFDPVRSEPGKSWGGLPCHPQTLQVEDLVVHPKYGKCEVLEIDGAWAKLEIKGDAARSVSIYELVFAGAEAQAHAVGTRVRHLTFGNGTIQIVTGSLATVTFDDGTSRSVLLAFLQIISTETDLGFPTQEHNANATGSVPDDASQGLVG